MNDRFLCKGCGKEYWRNCAWQHEKCLVVNKRTVVNKLVVNTVPVGRNADRHKKTDARKEYQRAWMRKRRAEAKENHGAR